MASAIARTGLGNVPVFLEVFYPFERDDASVLEAVRATASTLRPHFGGLARQRGEAWLERLSAAESATYSGKQRSQVAASPGPGAQSR